MKAETLFDVQGRVALVTGAAQGLGTVMCQVLVENGAIVYGVDRDQEGLERLAKTCALFPCPADTRDFAALQGIVQEITNAHGRLDIVLANAGISDRSGVPLHLAPNDDIAQVIDVNLNGTLTLARACLGQMVTQNCGKFIAVASMWGHAAPAGLFPRPAYAASKGAIVNLVRELAIEYAQHNIQINALCPGFFQTETRPRDAEHAKIMEEYTPLGRIAQAREIAGSVLFLASAASDFMTGSSLVIDGGVLAR
jgi:gluconate 5-dehydrogenase